MYQHAARMGERARGGRISRKGAKAQRSDKETGRVKCGFFRQQVFLGAFAPLRELLVSSD
jgi:hypothetical protein